MSVVGMLDIAGPWKWGGRRQGMVLAGVTLLVGVGLVPVSPPASAIEHTCSADTPFWPIRLHVYPGHGQVSPMSTPVQVSFWHGGDLCPTTYLLQRRLNGGSWDTIAQGAIEDEDDATVVQDSMRFGSVYRYRVYVSSTEGRTEVRSYPALKATLSQDNQGVTYLGGPWIKRSGRGFSAGRSVKSSGEGEANLTVSALAVGYVATHEPTGGDWTLTVDDGVFDQGSTVASATRYRVLTATVGLDDLADGAQPRTARVGIATSGGGIDVDALVLIEGSRSPAPGP